MNISSLSFFPILAVLAFIAVVLMVEGLYLLWNTYRGPEARKIEQRLRILTSGSDPAARSAVLKSRTLSESPALERMLHAVPQIGKLDNLLLQSGLEWTVARFLFLSIICAAIALAIASAARVLPAIAVALALAAMLLPLGYVQWRRVKRLRRLEQQLPDTLDLIGRALRAGHALPAGLQMAGQETMDPIASEIRFTNEEINFGVSMQQALTNLGDRVPITDMRYFVVAVLVQREAGGNLTEVLDGLSKLIRTRLKFHARIHVLTTEGRMSAWVLGLLPFAVAGVLNFANHDFIKILWTDPAGIMISNVVLTMMAVGAFWLYRLVRIRV